LNWALSGVANGIGQFSFIQVNNSNNDDGYTIPLYTNPLHAADDTISVSKGEWEAMLTDHKRMNWIDIELQKNGTLHFDRHGSAWTKLFSISTQHMKQKPSGRLAIDAAIQGESK
jgi:hypothetical protein